MPAATYFKTAATELRKAMQERQLEIDQKRKELADQEGQTRQTLQALQNDKADSEHRSADGNIDNNVRASLQRQAQQLQSQIADTERAFNDQKTAIQRYIDDIQRDIMNLEQQARQLESRS